MHGGRNPRERIKVVTSDSATEVVWRTLQRSSDTCGWVPAGVRGARLRCRGRSTYTAKPPLNNGVSPTECWHCVGLLCMVFSKGTAPKSAARECVCLALPMACHRTRRDHHLHLFAMILPSIPKHRSTFHRKRSALRSHACSDPTICVDIT